MAKNDKSKETVVAETQAIVQEQAAGALAQSEYGDEVGLGTANLTAGEKSIPFLSVLQTNSPEVEKKLVPGAEAGMIMNTVTKQLYPGNVGLIIQPVYCDRWIVEWKDRDKGGGLVGRHTATSPEAVEAYERNGNSWIGTKEKPIKRGENFMVDTRYLYGNILTPDGQEFSGEYFLLAASKSKVKPTQDFVTAIDILRGKPPMFAVRAHLTTVLQIQKGSGKEYYSVRFMPYLPGKTYLDTLIPGKGADGKKHPLLVVGRAYFDAVTGGTLKADFDTEKMEADESTEEKRHF